MRKDKEEPWLWIPFSPHKGTSFLKGSHEPGRVRIKVSPSVQVSMFCPCSTGHPPTLACHPGRGLREHLILPYPGQEGKQAQWKTRLLRGPSRTRKPSERGPNTAGRVRGWVETGLGCHVRGRETQHSSPWAGSPLLVMGLEVLKRGTWTLFCPLCLLGLHSPQTTAPPCMLSFLLTRN